MSSANKTPEYVPAGLLRTRREQNNRAYTRPGPLFSPVQQPLHPAPARFSARRNNHYTRTGLLSPRCNNHYARTGLLFSPVQQPLRPHPACFRPGATPIAPAPARFSARRNQHNNAKEKRNRERRTVRIGKRSKQSPKEGMPHRKARKKACLIIQYGA